MSTQEKYPVPNAEVSLKFMSWHLKETCDSAKVTALALKSIDSSLKTIAEYCQLSMGQRRVSPPVARQEPQYRNEEIPF